MQNCIPSIFDDKDKLITDGKEINKANQELYTSQGEVPFGKYDQFFPSLQIPCISTFDRDSLESDITLEEIKDAIRDLKPGRAPGEDGFPSDFYKKIFRISST